MDSIVLVGFGGHAKSVIDCIERENKYRVIGFTEIKKMEPYHGYAYLGSDEKLEMIHKHGVKFAFVCLGYMGNSDVRDRLYERLKSIGFTLPVICDPTAIISGDAVVEEGVFIGKRAIVNVGSFIGKMGIINTGAIIEHENHIGEYTHIAVNATLCGGVRVGSRCLVGANATIIQGVKIGSGCTIGAGSVVLRDVADKERIYGIAKKQVAE